VNSTCAAVVAQKDPLKALAAGVAGTLNNSPDKGPCMASSFEKDTVEVLANSTFSGRGCDLNCSSGRQWIFMSCNEFGYFQTTTGANQPFQGFTSGDIKAAGYAVCRAAFNVSEDYKGPKGNSIELLANTEYGARKLEGINITIPNGSMDPWHALGVVNATDLFYSQTQQLSEDERKVFIQDTAHCRDMYAPDTFAAWGHPDTYAIKLAHAKIRKDVLRYLS